MIILSPKDILIVKRKSLIADYDKETIFNLYQPMIGALGCALYMTLLYEAKNQKVTSVSTHEQILIKMQVTTQEFLKARGLLEAVGLLKTYLEGSEEEIKTYRYNLYAPKTPKSFFDNTLLYGMLIKYIGERDANRLKSLYNEDVSEEEGTEISKSFGEVFHPDFEDPAFKKALSASKERGRQTAKIDSEFNYDRFFESLESVSQINKNSLTKKELKEIERLCALFGVDEIAAADIVAHIYDPSQPKGSRIDFKEMSNMLQNSSNYSFLSSMHKKRDSGKVTSDSDLAHKIHLMETLSPKEFLTILQGGASPASSDLRLIDDLSAKFHLTPGVINALIDFILTVNNNVLSRAYAEKVAASLAREGITTVIDAMNYLKKTKKGQKRSKSNNQDNQPKEPTTESNIPTEETSEEDDVSWDDLINDLEGGDK